MVQSYLCIMADDLEEKPNTLHDFTSTKAALFDTFNKCKKWREDMLQEFRNKQYLESQRLLRLSAERQNQFEQILENTIKSPESEEKPKAPIPVCSDTSSISLGNDLDNFDSLQECSITGHLQRCFDDSSQSNISVNPNKVSSVVDKIPVFSEIRNSQFPTKNITAKEEQLVKGDATNGPTVKTKRPFLRKGTGLLRYMPKSSVNGQVAKDKLLAKPYTAPLKKTNHLPQKTLNLKPALRKTDVPSEYAKHIRFDIPFTDYEERSQSSGKDKLPQVSELVESTGINYDDQNKCNPLSSSSLEYSPTEGSKSEDTSQSANENLNLLKENKELEEFEMLEDFAQNSSFNSDSSIIQRILHGDSNKPFCSVQKDTVKPSSNNVVPVYKEVPKSSPENSKFPDKFGFSKCIEEIQAKKKVIQNCISDINSRKQALQNEITSSKQKQLDDSDVSERCSSPNEDLTSRERMPSSALSENGSNRDSLNLQDYPSTNFVGAFGDNADKAVCHHDCKCCNIEGLENAGNDWHEEEESVSEIPDENCADKRLHGKAVIQEKLLELQKEIYTYQDLNAELSSLKKEKEEIVRKLQKEQRNFNKFKETEMKKLEAKIKEERCQMKREKETFKRYQKFSKDHPTRKERDEINSLHQEVEKLQEELKRHKIKHSNDRRNWKSLLEAAERDRDRFKLENIKLDERCEDLLITLKNRMKKKETRSFDDKVEDNMQENTTETKDAEVQTQPEEFIYNIRKDSSEIVSKKTDVTAAKIRLDFNVASELDRNKLDIPEDSRNKTSDCCMDKNYPPERDNITLNCNSPRNSEKDIQNLSLISVSVESEYKETAYDNRIERMFASGERQIIFHSGTRKIISADKKMTKFLFYNGDEKEIFPDKRSIYRYVNGTTETTFPDGLKVIEFPSGEVQRHYPDGQQEIRSSNGTVHKISADGSEEIHSADGNVINLNSDGTKIIEFANGQREIRTAEFKRREFPDGIIRIIYNSGRVETRYPNGRVKIKDKEGNVVLDTKYTKYLGTPKEN